MSTSSISEMFKQLCDFDTPSGLFAYFLMSWLLTVDYRPKLTKQNIFHGLSVFPFLKISVSSSIACSWIWIFLHTSREVLIPVSFNIQNTYFQRHMIFTCIILCFETIRQINQVNFSPLLSSLLVDILKQLDSEHYILQCSHQLMRFKLKVKQANAMDHWWQSTI